MFFPFRHTPVTYLTTATNRFVLYINTISIDPYMGLFYIRFLLAETLSVSNWLLSARKHFVMDILSLGICKKKSFNNPSLVIDIVIIDLTISKKSYRPFFTKHFTLDLCISSFPCTIKQTHTFSIYQTLILATVCPRSSDQFYIITYYIKWGHYFLGIRYLLNLKKTYR